MIKSGYKPKEEPKPVESIKIETGTRRGTVKYTVNGKTVDNVLVKPLSQTASVNKGELEGEFALKDHKHNQYLEAKDVEFKGNAVIDDEQYLQLEESTPDPQDPTATPVNGNISIVLKRDENNALVIKITGLEHFAFINQLDYYEDDVDPQTSEVLHEAEVTVNFKTKMKDDLRTTFLEKDRNTAMDTGHTITAYDFILDDTQPTP